MCIRSVETSLNRYSQTAVGSDTVTGTPLKLYKQYNRYHACKPYTVFTMVNHAIMSGTLHLIINCKQLISNFQIFIRLTRRTHDNEFSKCNTK